MGRKFATGNASRTGLWTMQLKNAGNSYLLPYS